MAPSRAEQDELHPAIVGSADASASARVRAAPRAVERPAAVPLANMSQDELESWAIDALIGYLENPARYDPKKSALLTYLVMDVDGDIKNAYSSAQATRERFVEDVENESSRRNETTELRPRPDLGRAREAPRRYLTASTRTLASASWADCQSC